MVAKPLLVNFRYQPEPVVGPSGRIDGLGRAADTRPMTGGAAKAGAVCNSERCPQCDGLLSPRSPATKARSGSRRRKVLTSVFGELAAAQAAPAFTGGSSDGLGGMIIGLSL